MHRASVLVVDDEKTVRHLVRTILDREGYEVDEAEDGSYAIEKLKKDVFDVVVTDYRLGRGNGFDVLKAARSQAYRPEILLMTGYGSIESAVSAMKLGAFDFITKPFEPSQILESVEQAMQKRVSLVGPPPRGGGRWPIVGDREFVSASQKMKKLLEITDVIARADSTVLIQGESGTGKELLARIIHDKSARAGRSFLAINCGALPEPLLESELFGHVKGAFTGAVSDKKGFFEEAEGGTIFLDEIGDMPNSLQIKFLRVLQNREVRRVGSNQIKSINVRILAATNRNLDLLVGEGGFREDLYYRLNVIPVTLPPLRDRPDDIPELVNYFVETYGARLGKTMHGFSPKAMELLMTYDWPGNIRELENFVERCVALAGSPVVDLKDFRAMQELGIRLGNMKACPVSTRMDEASDSWEADFLIQQLEKNGWNQMRTAEALGISRSSLWRKMKKHDINPPE